METQILEGTFTEVQRRLSALPLKPEARLRVIVTEPGKPSTPEEALFANTPRRNGLFLVPIPGLTTVEEVNEALFRAEMEEVLGEDWEQNSFSSASHSSEQAE